MGDESIYHVRRCVYSNWIVCAISLVENETDVGIKGVV